MRSFQLGAVVVLTSGSKDKTVVAIIEGGKGYNVAWEDDHGTPHTMYYPAEALELASARDEAGAAVARRYFG